MNLIDDLKKAKFMGHPIHIMLIHFPSALIPASIVLDLLGVIFKDQSFVIAAYYTLTGGVWSGVAAALVGAVDYFNIPDEKTLARKKATLHLSLNIVWLAVFGTIWGLRMDEYPAIKPESIILIILSIISVILMLISNYLGGDLVLRHGIGTITKDVPEAKRTNKANV